MLHFKDGSLPEDASLPISAYIPLQSIVDYKGVRAHVITMAYTKGSQQVLGYSPENEQYVYMLQNYPKTFTLVCEELPTLFHTDPRIYNYEEKVEEKCFFPNLRVFQGPERTLADFQLKEKSKQQRSLKTTYDFEAVYIPELGIATPPEVNFHYNPVLTFEQNLEEYETGKFTIKPEKKFANCTAFERWAFHEASETRTNKRVNLGLLLDQPFTEKYNLSCINVIVMGNDDLLDANLSVKHLFDLELYKRPDLQKLADLSNKTFFEKFPLLLKDLNDKPMATTNIHQLLRLMASHQIDERHIAVVAINSKIPHIKDIAVEHMVAQAIMKLLSYSFATKHMKVDPNDQASFLVARFNEFKNGTILASQKTTLGTAEENVPSPGTIVNLKKREKRTTSGKDSRRASVKHDDEHKQFVLGFLRALFTDHPKSVQVWNQSIKPQVFNDYAYYVSSRDIEYMNKVSVFFAVEQAFGFTYEANTELLAEASSQSLEIFFKTSSATFNFTTLAWGLSFGDSVVEDIQAKVIESDAPIETKLRSMANYLLALDFRSDIDKDFIINMHCEYIDLLLTRGQADDLEDAEKALNNVILTRCRKDSFELVAYPN